MTAGPTRNRPDAARPTRPRRSRCPEGARRASRRDEQRGIARSNAGAHDQPRGQGDRGLVGQERGEECDAGRRGADPEDGGNAEAMYQVVADEPGRDHADRERHGRGRGDPGRGVQLVREVERPPVEGCALEDARGHSHRRERDERT